MHNFLISLLFLSCIKQLKEPLHKDKSWNIFRDRDYQPVNNNGIPLWENLEVFLDMRRENFYHLHNHCSMWIILVSWTCLPSVKGWERLCEDFMSVTMKHSLNAQTTPFVFYLRISELQIFNDEMTIKKILSFVSKLKMKRFMWIQNIFKNNINNFLKEGVTICD